MAETDKPAARRRAPAKRARRKPAATRVRKPRSLSPLEFLKSVYSEPIPDDADAATRARIVANKLAAAKAAAAYELQQRQPEAGEGELAALLRELEGRDGDGDG